MRLGLNASRPTALAILAAAAIFSAGAHLARGALPDVPVPPENPITEEKRLLGKILFWDEQLSSDDTVACGTCHRPAAGGADPRYRLNPGALAGTIDDVSGSPGIRRLDRDGQPLADPVFGDAPQVTRRTAPSVFGALWARSLFWDGRAEGALIDPDSGRVVISDGAALENQVLATLMNDAEMAKPGRQWRDLIARLEQRRPLALADRWPDDVEAAIGLYPSYPALFRAAFGDESIDAVRIAMAIATYERTLVADQTPWDRYQAGQQDALDSFARFGWSAFQTLKCVACHEPPLFSTDEFFNIGLRRSEHDAGRAAVSGDESDAGDMRIPSLRNVGLRTRFMHTGEFGRLGEAIAFYRDGASLPDADAMPDGSAYVFSITLQAAADLQSFLLSGLTDPRVADEAFPFDRPRLRSERENP